MESASTTDAPAWLRNGRRVLLRPFEYDSADAWRHAVIQALAPVVGTDLAGFCLVTENEAPLYSPSLDPAAADRLFELTVVDPRDIYRRAARLQVFDRDDLWGDILEFGPGKELYHEFFEPTGSVEEMGIATRDPTAPIPAGLSFHFEKPLDPEHTEEVRRVLTRIRPAFTAGVETFLRMEPGWLGLGPGLDILSEGVALFDANGHLRHVNPSLRTMLEDDPDARRVRRMIRATSAAARALADPPPGSCEPEARGCVRNVRTPSAKYRISGTFLEGRTAPGGLATLVAVQRLTPTLPSESTLGARFGLTPRQAEVALLLARGESNADIASTLEISIHTVRRHVEGVLRKTGLSSRWEVADRIRMTTEDVP